MKDKLKGVADRHRRRRRAGGRCGGRSPAPPAAATTTPPTSRSPARHSTARGRSRSAHTGGGKVTETEAGDEEGAYEVEVTRADGSQVDVHLDKAFNVISQAGDGDERGDED